MRNDIKTMSKRVARAVRYAIALCALGASAAAGAADLRGFVSNGPEGLLLFQVCNGAQLSRQTLRIDDKTPDEALTAGTVAVREIMLDSGRPLYLEFRGDVAGPVATARQFQRAIGHVETCADAPKDAPAGARLLASGEDPAWRFTATAAAAQLELIGGKPVRFPAAPFASPAADGKTRVYDAWSPLDGGTVRIEFVEQMCSDGRSETAYGARVTVRYGSQSFEGCAARF
jgi:uncharacterized membrane protein